MAGWNRAPQPRRQFWVTSSASTTGHHHGVRNGSALGRRTSSASLMRWVLRMKLTSGKGAAMPLCRVRQGLWLLRLEGGLIDTGVLPLLISLL